MLSIHLLGIPQLFEDDRALPLPSPPKALLLLAYLLVERRHAVPRETLAFRLWPDEREEEARANLRRHIHLLKRQLPPTDADRPWIVATRTMVQWNPHAACWLDVALLDEFDAERADDAAWEALIQAYRGDFLEGSYEDWVLAERRYLRGRYLRLLEGRIEQQKARGDLRGALQTTQVLLTHDPLRETAYRHLMELDYRLGDRAAALREFERCAAMLRESLGVEPMPETLSLRELIRTGRPLPPLPRPPSKPRPVPPPRAPAAPPRPAAQDAVSPPTVPRRRPALPGWLPLLLAALLLLAGWLGFRRASTLTLTLADGTTVEDTWITEEHPDTLYDPDDPQRKPAASYPQVHLSFFGYPYDRVLIRFALDRLPPQATVRHALFRVHLTPFINETLSEPRPATIALYRLLRPWDVQSATFHEPWGDSGPVAGVDYDPQPLGTFSFQDACWFEVEITDLVRRWQAHPDENHGLMLMLIEAPHGAHYWVDTVDQPLPELRPRLEIAYLP